ncbi:hypothetical protein CsSME_00018920 [Camellia sinensis var. sinensis]
MMPDGSTVGKSNTQPPEVGSNAAEFIRPRQMAIEGFKAQSEMVIDSLDRLITAWEEQNFCMAIQDSPVVPIGRSPRTDVLLKAEKAVLESGSSVFVIYMHTHICEHTHPTLTLNTKQIKVHMFIGWGKALLTLIHITSSILYTTR